MAAFTEEDYQRLDLQLLKISPVTLYHRTEVLANNISILEGYGYKIDKFDCTTWASVDDLFDQMSAALDFPDYFGRNFDALNDCLAYIEVPEESGRVVLLRGFDQFAKSHDKAAQVLLDILAHNSSFLMLWGKRFLTLVQSDDPEIKFHHLDCRAANWNHAEWLNADRGL